MRGRIGLFMNPSGLGSTTIGRTSKLVSCSAFSSSAGDGSGGGRGRGRVSPDSDKSLPPAGRGHGSGIPLPSSPFLHSYNSFVASNPPPRQPGLSQGRGGPVQQSFEGGIELGSQHKAPVFLKKDEFTGTRAEAESVESVPRQPIGEKNLPENILNVLSGTGRGIPDRKPVFENRVKEENRHIRPKQVGAPVIGAGRGGDRAEKSEKGSAGAKTKISREEAIKKAVGILSRGDDRREDGGAERGGGRRRRGGRSKDDSDDEVEDEDEGDKLVMGDDADGEKLAMELGPSMMAGLTEAFEEMATDVLPDPEEDEYLEAYDTNLKIELEPEYLMGDFETNPDIYENPPVPLREALEKMKPFLMAYEGIENQEEWEEILNETMEKVSLLKEIVDHYCGPDIATAKQQHEELERVAKTIPANVPNSVKNFTDRAVLSLQSNPGWGFHRKWQFMDKLALEVSKSCK
ncbi:uncharacterized protein LOC110704857 [Chenopodium quinoa]|uniref:uncharacterized protein LOC110704857 n=1 Tax=Chenopodium quinoa TaxID=63459 RepID=UPI000B77CCAE|nr:uncharacterized protein LOC110704857 [Chenopodium quinoa]